MAETEEAYEVWRLGGHGGAWQWWTGYANAVRQAGRRLEGRRILPPPSMARRLYGSAWTDRVRGYALNLALEALEETGR